MAEGEFAAAFKALAKDAAETARNISASIAKLTEKTAEIEETNLAALCRAVTGAVPAADEQGRRVLPLAGAAVMQCCVDFAVTLRCDRSGSAFDVRIEQGFTFTAVDGAGTLLDPEGDPTGLGPVLACCRTTVLQAAAFEDGRLEMAFADGSSLSVSTSADYEGWELAGPDGLRGVSGPGSKLTIWQPEGSNAVSADPAGGGS